MFVAAVVSACATVKEVPQGSMQAAECMADVLRPTPDTSEIKTLVMYEYVGAKAAVEYRFPDRLGRRRLARVSLSRETG